MHVLLLSPYPELIEPPIRDLGDQVVSSSAHPSGIDFSADLIVSFGYSHILPRSILSSVRRPIINLHISLLPWNRGSDPNFWSWFDDTPKGVSIHEIDTGIDTGPLLAQEPLQFANSHNETLESTYNSLRRRLVSLFSRTWPLIRDERISAVPQQGRGSYHRFKERERWWQALPKGPATPVRLIEEMGRQARDQDLALN